MDAKVTTEILTDGSKAYGVRFQATDENGITVSVDVACIDGPHATQLYNTLARAGAYAEINDTVDA